jgi:DNA-binding NarL/FixJ family response regulator
VARILIADDSEIIRHLHRQLAAQSPGWTVCGEAHNGREAVTMAAELKPDLVVVDLAMPQLDGIRAAAEMLKSAPNLPIILYSLYEMPHLELEAKKAGIREVVCKSADATALARAIEKLLQNPAPSGAPTLAAPVLPELFSTPHEPPSNAAATTADPAATPAADDPLAPN